MHASRCSPKAMTGSHESVENLTHFAATKLTMPIRGKQDFGKWVGPAATWLDPTNRVERARSRILPILHCLRHLKPSSLMCVAPCKRCCVSEAEADHSSADPRHGIGPGRLGLNVDDGIVGRRWRKNNKIEVKIGRLLVHASVIKDLPYKDPECCLG